MARVGRRFARTAGVRQACLLAGVALSVAGCIGMPQAGQVGTFGNNKANTVQDPVSGIGLFPSGPQPGSSPKGIVQEFLRASASYPTDTPIVQEYLAGSAKGWDPGWSVTVLKKIDVNPVGMLRAGPHGAQRALVEVSGPVQATFNGAGQIVSASAPGGQPGYQFTLVKVDNQWRISNLPRSYRLVKAYDFPQDYQAQDLYFFAATGPPIQSQSQGELLVPDSVFVPKGTPPQSLLTNLVTALAQDPSTTWLQGTARSGFPSDTKILGVAQYGATVTVNLGGAAVVSAPQDVLERISAQLVWTLAGPSASIPTVQSVELELNGHPWSPKSAPCGPGQAPAGEPYQKLASYECYDPFPSGPASFSYVGATGQPWSRCGSESVAQSGSIGSVVSVFGRTGSADSHQCGGYIDPQSNPVFPRALTTAALSTVAVSPDGDYVAGVSPSPARDTLYVGLAHGTAASFSAAERLKNTPGITSLSWDRGNNLWVAQGDTIWVVPGSGTTRSQASSAFALPVTGLAVAPDGVRIAVIVQNGAGSELELASINRGPQSGQVGVQRGSPAVHYSIESGVQLGPNLTDPISLTWYNADTLIVLDAESGGTTLWSVPVDGQQATQLQETPQGAISITADSAANVLVAGVSGGRLEFAVSTAGPWFDLTAGGLSPAYP